MPPSHERQSQRMQAMLFRKQRHSDIDQQDDNRVSGAKSVCGLFASRHVSDVAVATPQWRAVRWRSRIEVTSDLAWKESSIRTGRE